MTEIIINNLPPEHELRNRLLQGMYHRNKGTKDLKVLQIYYNKSASEIAKDLN